MNNPYIILGVKETATNNEIKMALKKQVNLYCDGRNDSRKNGDGEYLKEIFVNAARDLLSPVKRKEIDKELAESRSKNALDVYTEKKKDSNTTKRRVVKSVSKKPEIERRKPAQEVAKVRKENEELKDVKNVEVCLYDDNCIGLFKIIEWCKYPSSLYKYSGIVYIGIDSSKIGMKRLYENGYSVNCFIEPGDIWEVNGKRYLANCKINKTLSFDDMRFKLYRSGLISPYTIGKATASEMLEVMCYAADYFGIEKDNFKK